MQNPAESTAATLDIDTLMQRIRDTVQARRTDAPGAAPAPAPVPAVEHSPVDVGTFSQLETSFEEQAAISASVIESMEEFVTQLHDLQSRIGRVDDERDREIERLSDQVRRLEAQLDQVGGNIEENLREVEATRTRVFQLEPRQDDQFASLRQELKRYADAAAARSAAEIRELLTASSTRADEAHEQLAQQLDTRIDTLTKSLEEQANQLAQEMQPRLDILGQSLEQQADRLAQADADRSGDQERIAEELQKLHARTAADLSELAGRLTRVEASHHAMPTFSARLEELKGTVLPQLSEREAAHGQLQEQLDALSSELAAIKAAAAGQVGELRDALAPRFDEQSARLDQQADRIAAAEAAQASTAPQMTELRESLANDFAEQVGRFATQLSELQSHLQTLDQVHGSLIGKLDDHGAQLAARAEAQSGTAAELSAVRSGLETMRESVAAQTAGVAGVYESLDDLRGSLAGKIDELEARNATQASAQSAQAEELARLAAETPPQIAMLRSDLEAVRETLASHLPAVTGVYESLDDLRGSLAGKIDELEARNATQASAQSAQAEELARLAAETPPQIAMIRSDLETVRETLASHLPAVAGVYGLVDELRGVLSARMDERTTRWAAMEQAQSATATELAELAVRLAEARSDSGVVRETIDALNQKVEELRAAVTPRFEEQAALLSSTAAAQSSVEAELQRIASESASRSVEQEAALLAQQNARAAEVTAAVEELRARVIPVVEKLAQEQAELSRLQHASEVQSGSGAEALQQEIAELNQRLAAQAASVVSLQEEATRELSELRAITAAPAVPTAHRDDVESLLHIVEQLSAKFEIAAAYIAGSHAEATSLVGPTGGPAATPFDYYAFEQRYRGSRADIKQRQAKYLELFQGRAHVLDLGCGRGEFIELLRDHDIEATGVDANQDMIACCTVRELPVVQADLFQYLEESADDSFDALTVFQVIEHMKPDAILRLLALAQLKLTDGGLLLLETVNPNNQTAMANFYLDPTHIRPVPPALLWFMAESSGFKVECLKFSAPVADMHVPALLEITSNPPLGPSPYQDYALIAIKLEKNKISL